MILYPKIKKDFFPRIFGYEKKRKEEKNEEGGKKYIREKRKRFGYLYPNSPFG